MSFTDRDGRDVTYSHKADQKFYEKRANRNGEVRAVLAAFAPGMGRDLNIRRGDPGVLSGSGAPRAAVAKLDFREATRDELMTAHDNAGGGKAGTAAAQALLDEGLQLVKAEIVLGPNVDKTVKLHELGHVQQGLLDPTASFEQQPEAEAAKTIEDYDQSESEKFANRFADRAKKDDEPIDP
jgi:hypothetical protein